MIRLERPCNTLSGGGPFSELFRVALLSAFSRFSNIDFSGPGRRKRQNTMQFRVLGLAPPSPPTRFRCSRKSKKTPVVVLLESSTYNTNSDRISKFAGPPIPLAGLHKGASGEGAPPCFRNDPHR